MTTAWVTLARTSNQARGMARYAIDFLAGRGPTLAGAVEARVERFQLDAIGCAVSALAAGTNAPNVLRREALDYEVSAGRPGATCFGSRRRVAAEKVIAANCAAVREWDANGTNFGYNPARGDVRGEFGHNDFYPVVVAATQISERDGRTLVRGMILLDEIRGRLAEVFSLKDHKIDHVVHGAVASAVVYGAMLGATVDQIESALGMLVAHYIPFRAIRAGKQLSDSKGASAALGAEAAVLSMQRAMRGFIGPADIFRNPQAIFCLFEPPAEPDASPFDLVLASGGDEFAVMGMHFKLGLYEHQSAGAIQGLIDLLAREPGLLADADRLRAVRIRVYEPAYGIICDPAKRDPRTRQSADHSMVYIIATLLRKAFETRVTGWRELMLTPADYEESSLFHPLTRRIMNLIDIVHGGPEYDRKYPDGIPTSIEIECEGASAVSSGLVMHPAGHARYAGSDLDELLDHKFQVLAGMGVSDPEALGRRFSNLAEKTAGEILNLHDFEILNCP